MKAGFVLPKGDARDVMAMAVLAEKNGWDGFFVWEPVWGVDAWVSLAAAATQTSSIKLGTLLSPLSRMRPWKIASETATLDNLSGGRVILSVGLGAVDTGFKSFGEVIDTKQRAELMDECLDILQGLWRGQPFNYEGKHYKITELDFHPPASPVNQRKVTTWVVGLWPNERSMTRAMKYDGILPSVRNEDGSFRKLVHQDIESIRSRAIDQRRPEIDIIVEGRDPTDDTVKSRLEVSAWESAGATWYIEALWPVQFEENVRTLVTDRIKLGPPT